MGNIVRKSRRLSSRQAKDLYRNLGLKQTATLEEIRAAYHALALRAHPDQGGSTEEMIILTEARDSLVANRPRGRGRPRIYSYHKDGWAIVDVLQGNKVILQGFENRVSAEKHLEALRSMTPATPSESTKPDEPAAPSK